MKLDIKPGKYIVAVSGGVDSVVLLDVLHRGKSQLAVAHFDHGIRENSARDRKFVKNLAENYGLRFFYEEGVLGAGASEALAREKRYEFLNKIKKQAESDAIVTAHHQDDLLETVIINLLRGTGRKGLSSLKTRPGLIRPLLHCTKSEILDYAKQNKLEWREDETNKDEKYLRNHVRLNLVPKLSEEHKKALIDISLQSADMNHEIDKIIANLLSVEQKLSRKWLVSLDHNIASEIIAQWLRNNDARLDKKTIERLVIALKTTGEGKIIQINKDKYFAIDKGVIRIKS